ncbi:MAG: hypothetical protein CV088_13000 [Nitrospira sp. LK70]|nr:hypothetical protein [Nitrospira sp. LK70]
MHGRMHHTNRLGRIVAILLLWAFSLTLAVAIAAAESLNFLDDQIRFYPAQREGDRILIPFDQPPADNEEVLLLGHHTDLIPLKRLQQEPIKPQSMTHPRPHYVYGLTAGRLLSTREQFLVAVGKEITPLLKWTADDSMSGKRQASMDREVTDQLLAKLSSGPMSSMPDNADTSLSLEDIAISTGLMSSDSAKQLAASSCVKPDKGFEITGRQILTAQDSMATVFYLQQELLLQGALLQSTPDKIFGGNNYSGPSMKEVVGIVEPGGSCRILASATSDGYGLYTNGSLMPVGPISGIIALSTGQSIEKWLVLKSSMAAVWGYTFIDLSMPLSREPQRRFLREDKV